MVAYNSAGVTSLEFPNHGGSGYSGTRFLTDSFTYPSGTACLAVDVITMLSLPSGTTVLDMWVTVSASLASTCLMDVGTAGDDNYFIGDVAATAAVGGRMGEGTGDLPAFPPLTAETPVVVTFQSATTPTSAEVVITIIALVSDPIA